MDFPIDLVVTFVDDQDEVWQRAKSQYFDESGIKRFRSWNNLKYWFRCVDRNMPFIRTVHLVVSNIEQVPNWLDQGKVNVVLHDQIIPGKLLPTFNSTTIEMFLCMIPDLVEHFIYSNDDMLPVNPLDISDFFVDGLPVYDLITREQARNIFRMQCRNSYCLAMQATGKTQTVNTYFYNEHSMTPMLKSSCLELHDKVGNQIVDKCTKFREPWNCTQYLFPDYIIMTDRAKFGNYNYRYLTTDRVDEIVHELKNENRKILCINDSSSVDDFQYNMNMINGALDCKFPVKSRFEI